MQIEDDDEYQLPFRSRTRNIEWDVFCTKCGAEKGEPCIILRGPNKGKDSKRVHADRDDMFSMLNEDPWDK